MNNNIDNPIPFEIRILDWYWINGDKEDKNDLCMHGNVFVRIGKEIIANDYKCTISSTALYLLKSIKNEHVVGNENQMLPCCGNFFVPDDNLETVEIIGCPNGIDWSVTHSNEIVTFITTSEVEIVMQLSEYKKVVFNFADEVERLYEQSSPRNLPDDEYERKGYLAFWNEWRSRRHMD